MRWPWQKRRDHAVIKISISKEALRDVSPYSLDELVRREVWANLKPAIVQSIYEHEQKH